MYEHAGGTWYPIFTGCFNVGAPERYQLFTGGGGSPGVNASMVPLAFPFAKMSGSLLYGGYDQNRVVSDVLAFEGDFWQAVTLQDVSIRVIKGSSPFEAILDDNDTNKVATGLLAKGNTTMAPSGLTVLPDPCSPYFTLRKFTCDAAASHLPLIYKASLGLYLWNASSPRYKRIVASASALSFTFMDGRNTESLTIHVPFRRLNLMLSPPLSGEERAAGPVPCFTGGIGAYVMGCALFQDAFVSVNWEKNKIFLAQAPGPNIPAGVEAVSTQPDEIAISGGGNDWEKSWDGYWTPLTADEANGTSEMDVGTTNGSGGDAGC
ncbi:hypothetical protein VTI74DRAFT_10106 [Chaetomium olivicolor]